MFNYECEGNMTIINPFEDVYIKVTIDGKVFTMDHKKTRENGKIDNRKGKELTASIDKYGYKHIVLSSNGKRKTYTIHQLVAIAFIQNPNNKRTVNHINGNKLDNRVENLEWSTPKEQKIHAIKNKLCCKNIEVLSDANKRKSRSVIFQNKKYNSINEARRDTGIHSTVISKKGIFTNG